MLPIKNKNAIEIIFYIKKELLKSLELCEQINKINIFSFFNKNAILRNMTAKKVDWPAVRKNLPKKPDLWNCKDLCAFLEGHDLSSVVDAISIQFF